MKDFQSHLNLFLTDVNHFTKKKKIRVRKKGNEKFFYVVVSLGGIQGIRLQALVPPFSLILWNLHQVTLSPWVC